MVINPKIKSDKVLIHRCLAAIVGILILSQPMVATASITWVKIAQSQNSSAAYASVKATV